MQVKVSNVVKEKAEVQVGTAPEMLVPQETQSAPERVCPIERTLSLISGKWKILILKELSHGQQRYGELGRSIPQASSKMLIQQLREMEDSALVQRTVFPEVPPRVEYSLTPKGKSIFTVISELRRWGLENEEEVICCSGCKKCIPAP